LFGFFNFNWLFTVWLLKFQKLFGFQANMVQFINGLGLFLCAVTVCSMLQFYYTVVSIQILILNWFNILAW